MIFPGRTPKPYTHRDAVPYRPLDWTGIHPPDFPKGSVPAHVAIVMDGNGRWANRRGLTRIEGHRAGEEVLLDVVAGAIQAGVRHLSVYAFSTENWSRSPEEVRFLMGYNRDVLHRRRDQLNEWGVRIRWAGRKPRLWGSVIKELQFAEELTAANDTLTLTMCINYGGRIELVDAMRRIGDDIAAGRLKPAAITEKTIRRHLYVPDMPDVDLFLRSSGEQRTSNFLLWQSAYAEMVFLDTLWPDFSRTDLWGAIDTYLRRDRRFGGAVDAPTGGIDPSAVLVTSDVTETLKIDVWSDIACPWCYIGKRNLEQGLAAVAADADAPQVEVTFHSYELSPDTPVDFDGDELDFLAGHKGIPRERVREMLDHVTGVAAGSGLEYRFDLLKHTNTVKAHELLHFAKAQGAQHAMAERLMSAYFTEGRHVGRVEDLVALAAEAGLDAEAARDALDSGRHLADVRADQAQAQAYGIQGVPFFVIDGKYGVSGAQPADAFAQITRQVWAERQQA